MHFPMSPSRHAEIAEFAVGAIGDHRKTSTLNVNETSCARALGAHCFDCEAWVAMSSDVDKERAVQTLIEQIAQCQKSHKACRRDANFATDYAYGYSQCPAHRRRCVDAVIARYWTTTT